MNKTLILLFILYFIIPNTFGQNDSTNYHPPLDIPLILASNFGELRPNHFHMGLDFKTDGVTGKKLYSIEDGYVSRIKVSVYGYGRVIYIDHPNGVTSVYAHCRSFKGQIDSIVKAHQFKGENFEVEIFPKKHEILVKKGQVIALSGNSGGSQAPHLHFELRDTESEAALNPLLYGFDIADHKAPIIRNLKIYGITTDGFRIPKKAKVVRVNKGSSAYYISNNVVSIPASYLSKEGGLGLAFDVIDRFDQASNKCGLFGSTLKVNNKVVFGQKIDTIPFESTRFVNIHKDFREYSVNSRKFHKCFKTPQNDLPIYQNENSGVIKAKPGDTLALEYIAMDASGNKSTIKFKIIVLAGNIGPNYAASQNLILPDSSLSVSGKTSQIEFPSGCFYEPITIKNSTIDYSVGVGSIPIQKPYSITIAKDSVTNIDKNYLEFITNKGRKKIITGTYYKGKLTFSSKYLGTYKLKLDTLAPSISAQSFSTNASLTKNKTVKWRIKDSQTGIKDYDIYINGNWALLRYDYKTGYVYYTHDGTYSDKCKITIKVTDSVGNITERKTSAIFL